MDERGYALTPLAFLLIIPVVIIAISYGNIANELNTISTIAMGGDTTYGTAINVYTSIKVGATDAGRNAAFKATRKVIDDRKFFNNVEGSDSKAYIKSNTEVMLNDYIVSSCKDLQAETGRQVYINGNLVTNSTTTIITEDNINIIQKDPYGFYVEVKGGIPVKIVQGDQEYTGYTPDISTFVSIEGLEDPYIWLNTNYNSTDLIYSYPHYSYTTVGGADYHFDEIEPQGSDKNIHYLYECLEGTENPSGITPRPYYFPDTGGLSFFERLNNGTSDSTSSDARMSTFILGDPLFDAHGNNSAISHVDHEYFAQLTGEPIKVGGHMYLDPMGYPIYISSHYINDIFKLKTSY